MAAKPNYSFERRERDRLKAEKKAKRLADKKLAAENPTDDAAGPTDAPSTSEEQSSS
jgi:hypothetical protein